MRNQERFEVSAILIISLFLAIAVIGLVGKATAVNRTAAYPNLIAETRESFVEAENKTIYLTFDDGPSPNTEKILDILKKQGVKATFFVTGQNADKDYAAPLLRRIVEEGHTLGLHSYSHNFQEIYQSANSYLADLSKLNDYLYDSVGVYSEILRFPGGSGTINASPTVMKEIIREVTDRGYLYYDWHIVSGDDTPTVYEPWYLADQICRGAAGLDSAVVLLHDNNTPVTTPEAVDIAIDRLREEGYSFDRLTSRVEPVHIKTRRLD